MSYYYAWVLRWYNLEAKSRWDMAVLLEAVLFLQSVRAHTCTQNSYAFQVLNSGGPDSHEFSPLCI
jgi:hypothetical protein